MTGLPIPVNPHDRLVQDGASGGLSAGLVQSATVHGTLCRIIDRLRIVECNTVLNFILQWRPRCQRRQTLLTLPSI